MLLPRTIVLKLPIRDPARLPALVADCLYAGVSLIAVAGENARAVEDQVDDLVSADGRFLTTSAHPSDEDALSFALAWDDGRSALVLEL